MAVLYVSKGSSLTKANHTISVTKSQLQTLQSTVTDVQGRLQTSQSDLQATRDAVSPCLTKASEMFTTGNQTGQVSATVWNDVVTACNAAKEYLDSHS